MFPMLIVAAVLQAAAAPAPGASPAAANGADKVAAAPPAADPSKDFICRTEEVTGTRFAKKVCRRKAEFEQKARDEQLRLRQMQRPQYSCAMSHLGPC